MTPEHKQAIDAAQAHLARTNPVLAAALVELDRARTVVRAHEAGLLMLRERGAVGREISAAQGRLNGMRTKLGRACNRVRQAGGAA